MNIEDFITTLAMRPVATYNAWDQKLLYSFSDQIMRGSGFTEKQSSLALKIVKRHSAALSSFLKKDISQFVENPTFRYPIRKVNTAKRISIINDPVYGKVAKVEFPYNETTVDEIRKARDNMFYAQWDKDQKSWNFALTEESIDFLSELVKKDQFELDEDFQKYVNEFEDIKTNLDRYVPMLVSTENGLKFVNISKNLPDLESKDIISALFEARKKGIFTWDTTVSDYLDNSEISQITKDFLKTDPGENFHVNSENTPLFELADIVKYMSPCLIVIPGGSELEKLKMSCAFLKEIGVAEDEMTVMFRLPSTSDLNFNEFVRNNNLNSPITNNTKVVFVSSKLPKPVLKSKLHFNSVINLGHGNVHYTMRDFVTKHENMVFYSEKSKSRILNFGIM
jgi:hypothetical protein